MPVLEELLEPIDSAAEAGENLRYDPLFDSIREALTEEDEALPMGKWARQTKRADYALAASLAQDALRKRSKDLWLAVWLGEAMIQMEGYEALEPTLRLLAGLQQRFWPSLHPEVEDGDVSLRAAPVQWALHRYAVTIQKLPIAEGNIPYAAYKAVRAGLPYPGIAEALTTESLDAALKSTAVEFYVDAESKLTQALQTLEELRLFCDEHYDKDGPSFAGMRNALEEVHRVVAQQLRMRPPLKAETAVPAKEGAKLTPAPVEVEKVATEEPHDVSTEIPSASVSAPDTQAVEAMNVQVCEIPLSWDDAMNRVEVCASYLLDQQPENPACYLLVMALQWGREASGPVGVPATETRVALKRAREAEDWKVLLTQALRAMLDSSATRWLDTHHHVWQAAANLGTTRLQSLVSAVLNVRLAEDSTWAQESFDDDTPVASVDTQRWLKRELVSRTAPSGVEKEPALIQPVSAMESNVPVALAQELAAQGEIEQAVAMLMESVSTAQSGRDRFLLRMEVCRVCLQADHKELAAHLLRHMLGEAEELRLEHWEGPTLLGTLLAMLLNATNGDEANPEERAKLFARLCRVDPARALAAQAAQ